MAKVTFHMAQNGEPLCGRTSRRSYLLTTTHSAAVTCKACAAKLDAAADEGTLTPREAAVLDALRVSGAGNGGDFAVVEDIDAAALGLSAQQFGALLTTLETKRRIDVDVVYINGSFRSKGTKVTQVTFRGR